MTDSSPLVFSLGAVGISLVAVGVYHLAVVRPALAAARSRLATHDDIIGGGTKASDRLGEIEREAQAAAAERRRNEARLGELERLSQTDVSKVGFVRYDAFDDTGSELSYAMALLSRDGNGVVVSSIYSREDTRTYGKAVSEYKPAVNASDEELRAIELARSAT